MSEIPRLTRNDVVAFLERHYRSVRSQRALIALFGTGARDTIEDDKRGTFEIVPVRSELDLREQMPPVDGDDDARMVFLVPWRSQIPLDLAGRFSGNGKVWPVGKETRIHQLFAVSEYETGLERSPLIDHLLRRPGDLQLRAGGGRLTIARMWELWLENAWSVPVEGGLGLDTLLGWAAVDGRGPHFATAMAGDRAGVRQALLDHLTERFDGAGPVVWRAWERSEGRKVLEYAVLFEALAGAPASAGGLSSQAAGVAVWIKQTVKGLAGELEGDDEAGELAEAALLRVARLLGDAAGGALRHIGGPGQTGVEARAIVKSADARADLSDVRRALIASQRLPSAWRARLDGLGEVLDAGARESAAAGRAAAVIEARKQLRGLEDHVMFQDPDQTVVVKRAEMAVRLLAWLAQGDDERRAPGTTPYSDVERLGRWYVEDGGFVDWARRWARGGTESRFDRGVDAVVQAADQVRRDLDRRFARALVRWHEAGAPVKNVMPIHQAVDRVAVKFLDDDESRRLLVVLFDGMAWAQAVELVLSLQRLASPWGPLAWHGSSRGRVGASRVYPVVLANLPTVTEISRAAFFAGKAMKPAREHKTDKDVERWREHRGVGKYFSDGEVPRLLLRSEGHAADGSASREALGLIGDTSRRVVALVINAIDASLKGDTQTRNRWEVDDIKSLAKILDRAREAGRAVLVASDHGHVPADRLATVARSDRSKSRWRVWPGAGDPGGALAEYEVLIRADAAGDVWFPRGAEGVVLLADELHRYGGSAASGEHGGAALAEVVAPCFLIGSEDSVAAHDDPDQSVAPLYVPGWWYHDVPVAARAVGAAGESARAAGPAGAGTAARARPRARPESQLSLPVVGGPESPAESRAGASGAGAAAGQAGESGFARSELLQARATTRKLRDQVVRAVDFLASRSGVASAEAFAGAMGERLFRVGGLVSRLQEVLNVDGYQVIRYDHVGKQVHLDRDKLEQQFEVSL